MIADRSVDVIVSNCVLNLVEPRERQQLFGEMFRVLRPGGRAVISDIVADQTVSEHLRRDAQLWSGCISGAFAESEFLAAFRRAGFCEPAFVDYQKEPWAIVEGIEFRSVTVRAEKPTTQMVEISQPRDTSMTRLPSGGCCGGER
jgi:SAM-dependent methyltransferase